MCSWLQLSWAKQHSTSQKLTEATLVKKTCQYKDFVYKWIACQSMIMRWLEGWQKSQTIPR